jgi:hypothetical protein
MRQRDTKDKRAYGASEVLVCRAKDNSVSSTVVVIIALQRERGGRSQLVGAVVEAWASLHHQGYQGWPGQWAASLTGAWGCRIAVRGG